MKLFIAGTGAHEAIVRKHRVPYILESFVYIKPWQIEYMKECRGFMLDSGGFTFLHAIQKRKTKTGVDWNDYADRYGQFVADHGVKLFFELDIDAMVGHEEVLKLTQRLEKRAGRRCIPVWHYNRGKAEYVRLCRDYEYVAFGGLVTGEVASDAFKFFPKLIDVAHEQGAQIHGLGITKDLSRHTFDSVDSTTWTNAARYGNLSFFTGDRMTRQMADRKSGRRNKLTQRDRLDMTLGEWSKYAQYLDRELI